MLWLKRLMWLLSVVYVAYVAILYTMQEKILFLSEPVDQDFVYTFQHSTEEIRLENGDGHLHGILFKNDNKKPTKGIVLYFKGNMGNVGHSEQLAELFLKLGYDVVSMDYRGSGKSRGPLSEQALLKDAELWFDWAAQHYDNKVRVVGYSLGTTFASHVAAIKEASHTILFAPMRSILDIAERRYPIVPAFITRFPLKSYEKLRQAKGQIVIYHGTKDEIIPYESGASLKTELGSDDVFLAVVGANHYTVAMQDEVQKDITDRW
ncbi:alpha/beta hydrolase [Kordiimonas pumila]|uniref:Alpha/beta hydrolase n=1 Tax=Kordiimonas pumila TaxID=2161677 RepID=A0ABV7D1R6_9PROT|nr:alpha/beta fold hydrolase [Kordiimonas pumila]